MTSLRRLAHSYLYLHVMVAVVGQWTADAPANELLVNSNVELVGLPAGWSLTETVTDLPGAFVNSAEMNSGFANNPPNTPGETGLFLKAFAGNSAPFASQNRKINAILSQTVPGAAGETYSFKGDAKFESNYSGGVDFLDVASPSGEIESPTNDIWELAFLDASDAVLGTPTTLNLRTVQFGDNMFHTNTLIDTAPAGTAKVRVTAAAYDMVANINPGQSAGYDNFSLTSAGAPATELLANGRLNDPAITPGWTTIEPTGLDNIQFAVGTFANHTTGGLSGVWFRSFIGGDATLLQTVPAAAGEKYEFSAWSKWEANYPGGIPDSGTETMLEIAFLDGNAAVIGTPETLDLRTVQMNDNTWRQFSLDGTAPAGTQSVRVSAVATGFPGVGGASLAAVFDDFSLALLPSGVPGDYNGDDVVNAADYTIWRDHFGQSFTLNNEQPGAMTPGVVDQEDYDFWKLQFGTTAGSGAAAASVVAVPEASSGCLVLAGLVTVLGHLRRRS